jgi:hypothetical protein
MITRELMPFVSKLMHVYALFRECFCDRVINREAGDCGLSVHQIWTFGIFYLWDMFKAKPCNILLQLKHYITIQVSNLITVGLLFFLGAKAAGVWL